jgi:hypothetical protein
MEVKQFNVDLMKSCSTRARARSPTHVITDFLLFFFFLCKCMDP